MPQTHFHLAALPSTSDESLRFCAARHTRDSIFAVLVLSVVLLYSNCTSFCHSERDHIGVDAEAANPAEQKQQLVKGASCTYEENQGFIFTARTSSTDVHGSIPIAHPTGLRACDDHDRSAL